MTDHLTRYGFTFGPAEVNRLTHVPGRGRTLEIRTDHACIQVYISEAGRKIEVHRVHVQPEHRQEVERSAA